MTWYLVAPEGAFQEAVTVPSARDRLTEETASGGEVGRLGRCRDHPREQPQEPESPAAKQSSERSWISYPPHGAVESPQRGEGITRNSTIDEFPLRIPKPNELPSRESCPPLSLRDISPRFQRGGGKEKQSRPRAAHPKSPPAGGGPPAYAGATSLGVESQIVSREQLFPIASARDHLARRPPAHLNILQRPAELMPRRM